MASAPPPPPASSAVKGVIKSAEALPLTVEELTPAWFTKILGRPVKEAAVVEAMHGTASKILVKLVYEKEEDNAGEPTELCVKGGFNPALLALHPSLYAVYRLEAEFYYYIGPTVSMRLVPAYWCGTDTANGQGIVVLRDLKHAGYTFGDPLEPWPVARARAGVEQIAALHARTWGGRAEDFPWLSTEFSLRDVILSMLVPAEWDKRFTDPAVRPPVPEFLIADRERIVAAFKTLWRTTDPALRCIVHGDTHIGNTFITPAGEPGFLDWQGIHPGSAIHDVAYFIVGALTVEDRRANEVALFEHYLATLHAAGGPKLERAAVWDEYRKHHLHGFAWALTGPMMQTKERVDVMSERHCAAIVDHKSLELLEALPEHGKE